MGLFTVNQICDILKTNPETIRRWIKSGKLMASQTSRKDGNVITKEAFDKFLSNNPKYAGIAKENGEAFGNDNISKEDLYKSIEEEIKKSKKKIEELTVLLKKAKEEKNDGK